MKHITLLVGSETDMHIAESVKKVLDVYEVPYLCEVSSAHKNPDRVREIVRDSTSDVFICVASLSAALPGFVASITAKPVIGVPVDAKLGGLDSLLSTVQMPAGVPVAAVGVDNGKNAAYLALRMLGIKYPEALVKSGEGMPASTESPSSFAFFDLPGSSTTDTSSSDQTEDLESAEDENPKERPSGDWL